MHQRRAVAIVHGNNGTAARKVHYGSGTGAHHHRADHSSPRTWLIAAVCLLGVIAMFELAGRPNLFAGRGGGAVAGHGPQPNGGSADAASQAVAGAMHHGDGGGDYELN